MMDADRKKKLRAFALAFADPTSHSYQNAVDSYLFAFAPSEEEIKAEGLPSISRKAHRARYHPAVVKAINGIQEKIQSAAGLSKEEYILLLLKREAEYSTRGIPGDAAASARILQYVGKVVGHLTERPLVIEDNRPQLSGEEIATALISAAERLQRLRQPNPMPLLANAEIVVEPEEVK